MKSPDVRIIEYRDEYQPEFKALNLEWLEQYNLLEPRDLEALDHPRETIINTGGVIYLAMINGKVAGTGAVIYEHDEYELAKMTVAPEFRGRGISKMLIEVCLQFVKSKGADKLMLYSNSKLVPALKLYEAYGFQHVTVGNAPFQTADVKMELKFIR